MSSIYIHDHKSIAKNIVGFGKMNQLSVSKKSAELAGLKNCRENQLGRNIVLEKERAMEDKTKSYSTRIQ